MGDIQQDEEKFKKRRGREAAELEKDSQFLNEESSVDDDLFDPDQEFDPTLEEDDEDEWEVREDQNHI